MFRAPIALRPSVAFRLPLRLRLPVRAGAFTFSRSFANASKPYTLPDMPYDYSALEPFISAEIMKIHHTKHHQTYVNNLNAALDQYGDAQAKGDITKQIALQGAIKFNGGGHINHSIFWTNLASPKSGGGGEPTGELAAAINAQFGSFANFQTKFATAAAAVQGSGWGWLGYNRDFRRVEIATCANQDPLTALTPLLGIDVWEHAYYLQYKNVRPDYLKAVWNVINWKDVTRRFEAARK
jgi:Fe-Mn family superoxide dismutase